MVNEADYSAISSDLIFPQRTASRTKVVDVIMHVSSQTYVDVTMGVFTSRKVAEKLL
jgi:hypothetical protein